MSLRTYWKVAAAVLGALLLGWWLVGHRGAAADWQGHASPGALSGAHATLAERCSACHSPGENPPASKCIACHASETGLLQRQPTAFHAAIDRCGQCHREHRGDTANLREMDHLALAQIGLRQLQQDTADAERSWEPLTQWVRAHDRPALPTASHPQVTALEMTLNCQACHATKDRHVGLFGPDCASCHATAAWTISQFQHPSPDSRDCAQCHQAPPSHYMMHFEMVSKKVARQEDTRVEACCGRAQVNQCYRCHLTTSWNDIRGVGWYKHH